MDSHALRAAIVAVTVSMTSVPAAAAPPPPQLASQPEADADEAVDAARPIPKWKWAGLGIGIGVTIQGIVTAAVGTSLLRKSRGEVFDAAQESLSDCVDPTGFNSVPCEDPSDAPNEANDVDPNMAGDLCDAGRSNRDALGNPLPEGVVRNAAVSDACTRGDTMRTVSIAGFAVMGVGLATTAVFTALLLAPRRKSRAAAALRRHEATMGFTPAPGGGFVGTRFRF